ncbi:SigE family RNA polymerase sigma factor [Micromonospora halotolerans]|uniref:SigE family RNA polymerase sigma factor n=1 Tax=Micromonospora halotolerans TaxID=709879 RepID=A0ABZ0A738_9ACTN|nr:SigE family RNA polymerase sigma factor [Micromonospora halotolerans]WNM42765.1 SigE family RNA polymerase sigma factor [Micromonospora halotolerans]
MDEDDRARLAEFVTSRTPALMRVAYLLTGDRHAAEDLFQSALARTIPKWRTLRHADPEGYLRAVMYREQVSWWRRRRRRRETALTGADEAVQPDTSGGTDVRLAMRAALRLLPPAQRTVLVLRYYEDLTETQVAEALGCSVGTVRSRTHRAVTRLRQLMPDVELLEVRR